MKQGDEHWPDVADMFPSAVGWATDPAEGGDYHFFVAVAEDGDAVGGSVIEIGTLRFGPLADMPVGYLEDILALEDHRRKGVGTALLRATLNHAWEHGCENVRWTVTYDNLPALALYRSMGLGFIPDEDPSQTEPERQYTVVAINPTRAEQEYGASRQ
ncbi:MAG: GNAT family N-acetyltransferase [Verrucomicrobia bacterium]|nr:GNAT family N-acetyltransferase [Verrucomicrobiota bacterium]